VYGSVADEFADSTNHISKPSSAWIGGMQLKLWPFLWYFCLFWPKFGCRGNVPQTPAIRNVFFGLVDHENPPVISNCILVISRRNAFKCIYSNFSPKIGWRGNDSLSLVYESVTDEFPDSTDIISKGNSAWICCTQLKLWLFLWYFLPILAKIWLPWQCPLDPCSQKCLFCISRPRKLLL